MNKKIQVSIFCLTMLVLSVSAQKRVVLDNYYNNETNAKTGLPFHYLWTDTAMSGFSQFGELFKAKGGVLSTLSTKPDKQALKNTDIFIMVDPDTKDESANPKYMDATAAASIAAWVKQGGVLLLMANNYKNAELDSIGLLTNYFGMQFTHETLHPELSENGQTLIAEAKYGKGYVLVIGDPWLYNEYIEHFYLPADFENGKAARNLVNLLMSK
jgi:unsaturated rhamnogalacturonyl hydrolase